MKKPVQPDKGQLKKLIQEVMDDVACACGTIGDSYRYDKDSQNHFHFHGQEDYINSLLKKYNRGDI